jgi:hypothetical protein
MSAAYTLKLSVQVLDFEDMRLLIQLARLVCDFCSSDQRFACGFLQIPSRDGHPCRPANGSPCRVHGRLSLPSERGPAGRTQKKAALRTKGGLLLSGGTLIRLLNYKHVITDGLIQLNLFDSVLSKESPLLHLQALRKTERYEHAFDFLKL